jgi:hypothetical protein
VFNLVSSLRVVIPHESASEGFLLLIQAALRWTARTLAS